MLLCASRKAPSRCCILRKLRAGRGCLIPASSRKSISRFLVGTTGDIPARAIIFKPLQRRLARCCQRFPCRPLSAWQHELLLFPDGLVLPSCPALYPANLASDPALPASALFRRSHRK